MFEQLTAGAQRVLQELSQTLPESASAEHVNRQLLSLLQNDEGIAAELLVDLPPLWETDVPTHPALARQFDFLEWKQTLIRAANRFAIQTNNVADIGTEHLLLAVLELSASAAATLTELGLPPRQIAEKVLPGDATISVPEEEFVQIHSETPNVLQVSGLERTLDASANRCREGFRVVEDFVRFQLDDELISRGLKELRHQVQTILSQLGQQHWVRARDTEHDVGTRSSVASERFRGSLLDVVRANMKRVEEALRSLEEFSKVIDAELSLQLQACRYRFYTLEKSLEINLHSRSRLHSARLYLLVTRALCRYDAEETIRHALETGVDVIQLREKQMPDAELIPYALRVRSMTRQMGALLIINDRPDIAAIVDADGVHVGQEEMPVEMVRRIVGGNRLIGVSTHSLPQVRAAIFNGADYLGVGPVFTSPTKTFAALAGLEYVTEVAEETSLPWFAIGGITLENWPLLKQAGAKRIAVSSAICQAPHPRGVTQALAEALRP